MVFNDVYELNILNEWKPLKYKPIRIFVSVIVVIEIKILHFIYSNSIFPF